MSSRIPAAEDRQAVTTFMDMVSHDLMNDQQAILSYLELVLADEGLGPKSKEYALKAVSHVRTSTLMIEHARHLAEMMASGKPNLRPHDLVEAASKAAAEVPQVFPTQDIKVRLTQPKGSAMVLANGGLHDLILSLLMNAVRLDTSSKVVLEIRVSERKDQGKDFWTIEVEDKNATLPSPIKADDIGGLLTKDSSVTVKMAGLMFAKIVSSGLGGDFEAVDLKPKGAAFRVSLRRASKA